jgi:CRISPR/Cas system-associated endoribonuclease Cas2
MAIKEQSYGQVLNTKYSFSRHQIPKAGTYCGNLKGNLPANIISSMRAARYLIFSLMVLSVSILHGQQKAFNWVPQNPDSFRIGPGYHSGVAVYNPHGWEAVHVRLDVDARHPVSVGVVRLEDWNNAVRNPELLPRLDYACLTEGVTHVSYSCNFYASYAARVVVVRDVRGSERPIVTGAAAPFVRFGINEVFANDVRVTPYRWDCVSNCDLPDPPQFAWVELRREKYEITSALKSYGPFTPERDGNKMRIRVKAQEPMTVAVVPSNLADELYAHREQAREILAKSACKQYGIQSSTFECALQKEDGTLQVVLLPETETKKKKKAEITISTVQCVANCGP